MTSLLWIDLRVDKSQDDLLSSLPNYFRIYCVPEIAMISSTIDRTSPHLLCFDYDYPDVLKLKALWRTKRAFPSIPILMLTDYHSEELAIWALRARVWDYMVKPVRIEDFCTRMIALSEPREESSGGVEVIYLPMCPIPIQIQFCGFTKRPATSTVTTPAISYIEVNYSERIALDVVARHCGLGRFQFSRVFKEERGITFRDFLNQYRISKAIELLKDSNASVTDVAFSVGFNHLSYFAQTFRRFVGFNPSVYRKSLKSKGIANRVAFP